MASVRNHRSSYAGALELLMMMGFVAAGATANAAPVRAGSADLPRAATPADDDDDGPQASFRLPYVIVVTPRGRATEAFDAARDTAVVSARGVRRQQPRTVTDALKGAPGVLVQETNRGSGTPILRGLIGPNNLYMVDYTRFITSLWRNGPSQYLTLFDPFALAAVEVIRGPGSVQYGNGAMGGVVHLLTASAPDGRRRRGWSASAGVQGSSADMGVLSHASVSYADADRSIQLGGGYGRFGQLSIGSANDAGVLFDGIEPLSSYSQASWRGKGEFRLGGDWLLTATYLGFLMADAPRVEGLGNGDHRTYDNTDQLGIVSLVKAPKHPAGIVRKLRFALSGHRIGEQTRRVRCVRDELPGRLQECIDETGGIVDKLQTEQASVVVPGAVARASFGLLERDRLTLDVGADAYYDIVDSAAQVAKATESFVQTPDTPRFSANSSYLDTGAFVHGALRLAELGRAIGTLSLAAGGRVSHVRAHASEVPGIGDVRYANTGFVGTAGLQLLATQQHNVFFNFVQGFRAPRLEETTVLGDTGSQYELPNPDLQPIRSNTLEFGGRLRRWRRFSIAGSLFTTWLSGVITSQPATTDDGRTEVDGKRVTRRVNAGSSLYRGAELAASARWWRVLVKLNATWTKGNDTLADGRTEPARRIPPLFGRAGVRYLHPPRVWWIEAFAQGAARQDQLSSGDRADLRVCESARYSGQVYPGDTCSGTPAWVTANLRAGWRSGGRFEVQLAALNLLDTRYKTHGSGFYSPGREVRLSLLGRL